FRDGELVATEDVTGTSTVVSGDQGHAYTFAVRAHNQVGPSDAWSAPSNPVNPSAAPSAPTNVLATFVYSAGERRLQVTWDPPADTGGEQVTYAVTMDGTEVASDLAETGWSTGDVADRSYAFAVTAINVRGRSTADAPAVSTFSRPGTPGTPSARVPAADNSAQLTLSPAGGNNRTPDRTEVQLEGGAI